MKYIKVKASRGRKVMVRVLSPVTDYLEVGTLAEGMVNYKDRSISSGNKARKNVSVPDGGISRLLGINWVAVDEKLNAVLMPDFKGVDGFDAERHNNLNLRALYRPPLIDTQQRIILIGVIILFVCLVIIYIKLNSIQEVITGLNTITGATL